MTLLRHGWRALHALAALGLGGLALANAHALAALDRGADGTLAFSFAFFVVVPLTLVSVVAQVITRVRGGRPWDGLDSAIAAGEVAAVIGAVTTLFV